MNDIAEARDILGRRILPGNRVLFTLVGRSRLRIGIVMQVGSPIWVLVSYNSKFDVGTWARPQDCIITENNYESVS